MDVWDRPTIADEPAGGEPTSGQGEPAGQAEPEPVEPTPVEPTQPTEPKPTEPTATPAAQPPAIDPTAIARAIVQAQKEAATPAEPAPKQMTDEEFRKAVNYAEANAEQVAALLQGGEPAVAAMNQIIQSTARQAMTVAAMHAQQLIQQYRSQMDQQLAPYMAMADRVNQQNFEMEFLDTHKDLAPYCSRGENGQSLLDYAADQLIKQGYNPGSYSRADNMKRIAETVRGFITQFGVKPAAATPQPAAPGQPKPAMPTMSSGGQGGTQANSRNRPPPSDGGAMAVWD